MTVDWHVAQTTVVVNILKLINVRGPFSRPYIRRTLLFAIENWFEPKHGLGTAISLPLGTEWCISLVSLSLKHFFLVVTEFPSRFVILFWKLDHHGPSATVLLCRLHMYYQTAETSKTEGLDTLKALFQVPWHEDNIYSILFYLSG